MIGSVPFKEIHISLNNFMPRGNRRPTKKMVAAVMSRTTLKDHVTTITPPSWSTYQFDIYPLGQSPHLLPLAISPRLQCVKYVNPWNFQRSSILSRYVLRRHLSLAIRVTPYHITTQAHGWQHLCNSSIIRNSKTVRRSFKGSPYESSWFILY